MNTKKSLHFRPDWYITESHGADTSGTAFRNGARYHTGGVLQHLYVYIQ